MNYNRRLLMGGIGAVSLASIGAALAPANSVMAADYKAIVVVFLGGGHDGNNILVPMDGAYLDYANSRPSLALSKDSLLRLSGSHIGHIFGFTPSIRALHDLFERKRLAVVANVGALIEPATVENVRNRAVKLPPFLGSHTSQEQWIQGWMGGDEDRTGWAGRSLDLIPASMRSRQPLISLAREHTALLAKSTPLSFAESDASSNWGAVNLTNMQDPMARRIEWASLLQASNLYEEEFIRSTRRAYLDTLEFAVSQQKGPSLTGVFPKSSFSRLPDDLRFVAKHIGYSKSYGAQRQVYLIRDPGYDTHANQLNTGEINPGLDRRLQIVSQSLSAFDKSIIDMGLDTQVLTIVMSEFGRTLEPAAGEGSDHAWGNHWMALGGAVKGGIVYGLDFPTLLTGGVSDASIFTPMRGQWLPQYSSDQFVADAMRWVGLSENQLITAMPNLANFRNQGVGYI